MKKAENSFIELIKTIGFAVVLVVLVHSLFYKPFHIPSPSMASTLLIGDYLFVAKFPYGYSKYSLPFSPNLFDGRIFSAHPKRGDVVVFRPPRDPNTDWIKRVIGLPGDRVQIIEGILHINGEKAVLELIGERLWRDQFGRSYKSDLYEETLPNGVKHQIMKTDPFGTGRKDNTQEFTVPEGHYFMMGDNRDFSDDSRFIGYIPQENLVGRADFVFFSTDIPTYDEKSWWKIWTWPTATRYSRFFKLIE